MVALVRGSVGVGVPWTMPKIVAANLLTNRFTQKEDRARTQGRHMRGRAQGRGVRETAQTLS
jgi:hypothetical protein